MSGEAEARRVMGNVHIAITARAVERKQRKGRRKRDIREGKTDDAAIPNIVDRVTMSDLCKHFLLADPYRRIFRHISAD